MDAKLIIDLQKCKQCDKCTAACSYKHHPENSGIDALLEKVRFALICRKCQAAPCTNACPQKALEKVSAEDGKESILKRHNMLCTACGTCAIACPFGTIYTELTPFASSVCDLSKNRLKAGEKPLCVTTCTYGALEYKEVAAGPDLTEVFDGVVVKVAGGELWQPFLREKAKK